MKCLLCGGKTKLKKASFIYLEEKPYSMTLISITNVPTKVCEQCGEKSYSREVSNKLYAICTDALDNMKLETISTRKRNPYDVSIPVINFVHQAEWRHL